MRCIVKTKSRMKRWKAAILKEGFNFGALQQTFGPICIMSNKSTPPSGFSRTVMSYVQQSNDLENPLGGVGLFHMIHIGHAQAFFLGFSMQTTVKHQICALSAIDRGTFNTFCITTRYAVSSLLYVSSPFLSFVAFIIHQDRLSNCKQDARKNQKQTKTVKIL